MTKNENKKMKQKSKYIKKEPVSKLKTETKHTIWAIIFLLLHFFFIICIWLGWCRRRVYI